MLFSFVWHQSYFVMESNLDQVHMYHINWFFSDIPESSVTGFDATNVTSRLPDSSTTDEDSSVDNYSTSKQSEATSTTGTESSSTTTKQKTTVDTSSSEGKSTTEMLPEPELKPQPPIVDYPGGIYPTPARPPRKRPERVTSETSEIIALIIGIIAGALIAVILIILVILKFKSRGERSCKIDDGKGYQQGPNAALLGNTSTNGQTQFQINGALRNGDRGQMQKSKKRDSKDIKEWYV